MENPYNPPSSDISQKGNSVVRPVEMPASLKILKWVLILIIAILAMRILPALIQLPAALGSNLPGSTLAAFTVGIILKVVFLVLIVAALKWTRQRNSRGRWGSLIIVAICMGSLGSSMPMMSDGASQEQAAFQLGSAIAIILPWLGFLALGLCLAFSKSVKAYFNGVAPSR